MEDNKVILLPKKVSGEVEIVELPDFQDFQRTKQYLATSEKLYELKAVDGKGLPKSIIFENESEGRIQELEQVIITTEFNVTYLLISLLFAQPSTTTQKNFITIENIIDNHSWLNKLSYPLIQTGLNNICDVIEEGDDFFYKINPEKINQYISTKVDKIAQHLSQEHNSLFLKLKLNLYVDSETEIPENYLPLEIRYQSIQVVKQNLVNNVDIPALNEDFDDLLKYKKDVVKKLTSKQLMNTQPASEHKPKPSNNTNKAKAKKPVKKVAVGKGALDSFFTKKK